MIKGLPLKSGKLIHLSSFVKDALIHVGGRIGPDYIPYLSKYQVIISNNYRIAYLSVFYIHVTKFHSRRDLILNLFRESYWIINAKFLIHKVFKSCLYCKRLKNQLKPPIMSDLPPERLLHFYHNFILLG